MNTLKVQDGPPKEWQKYDLCLVLPTESDTCKIRSDSIVFIRTVAKLLGRKYLYIYYSSDGTKAYILIRAGLKLLRAKAHSEKWQLQLDEHACKQAAYSGSDGGFVSAFSVTHVPQITSLRPFAYLYADYNAEEEIEHLYKRSRHTKHPFHKTLRIKMLFDFFEKNSSTEQALSLEKLRHAGTITEMFAVHFLRERDEIATHMLSCRPQRVPIQLLQHYFGEEITIYFVFLEHLFNWQFLPAVVGVAFQATAITFDDYDRSEIPAFAFFLIFWNIMALQSWRRKQQFLALKWNTLGTDTETLLKDHTRFQFYGVQIRSYIDGRETLYFPQYKRIYFYILSFFIFILSAAATLGSAGLIYYYARPRITRTIVAPYEQWVISGGTALQIMVCNHLYYYFALFTTEWENHRTEGAFVNSLSLKVGAFQIINTLATCYYLAFAARYVPAERGRRINSLGDCGYDNCMFPLAINVVSIAGVRFLCRIIGRFFLPYLRYWILFICFKGYSDRHLSRREQAILRAAEARKARRGSQATNDPADDDNGIPLTSKNNGHHHAVASVDDDSEWRPNQEHHPAAELGEIYRDNYAQDGVFDDEEAGNGARPRSLNRQGTFSGVSPLRSTNNLLNTTNNSNSHSTVKSPAKDTTGVNTRSAESVASEDTKRRLRGTFSRPGMSPPPIVQRPSLTGSQFAAAARANQPATNTNNIGVEDEDKEDDISELGVEEVDDDDSFDEDDEDDLAEAKRRESGRHSQGHENENGVERPRPSKSNPRTMSSYLQYRQQQDAIDEEAPPSPSSSRHRKQHHQQKPRAPEPQDDEVTLGYTPSHVDNNASDDDSSAVNFGDPFHSYLWHTYDHVREKVLNYHDLLGLVAIAWCFGAALPGVFVILFVFLAVESRGHAWRLLFLCPRPVPRPAENIGAWLGIYEVCLGLGILTNAGLILFTMTNFAHWSLGYKCAMWIGIVIALLAFNHGLSLFFSMVPEAVTIQQQRSRFVESKLVKRHPDVEDTLPVELL